LAKDLEARLAQAGEDELIPAIVYFRDRLNVEDFAGNPRALVFSLQAFAEQKQADCAAYLARQEASGQAAQVIRFWVTNAIAVKADKETLIALAARDDVRTIYYDETIHVLDPQPLPANSPQPTTRQAGPVTYGLRIIRADEVWDQLSIDGTGVLIGEIDTGVDVTHPDVRPKYKGGPGSWVDYSGTNYPTPTDVDGHGTHVMGTMCGGNASGTQIGVAPGAKWIAAKGLDDTGSGTLSGLMQCMQWMLDPDGNPNTTDDKPAVVNNSWGGDGENEAFRDVVRAWIAAGIFPAFAIGNSGPAPRTTGYPGNYPESFATGATDDQDVIADFSSRGPATYDGRDWIRPDVSAPGVQVYSSIPGGQWAAYDGTSMSSPHTAGVVALMLQANPGLTVDEIKQVLETTAKDLGTPGKDNDYGSGRIDAYAAVTEAIRLSLRPKKLSLLINDGDEWTDSTDVTLSLSGENLDSTAQVRFLREVGKVNLQNPPSLNDPRWSSWMPYQATIDWTVLSPQANGRPVEGMTAVYFHATNSVGDSLEVAGDDIFLNYPPRLVSVVGVNDTHVDLFFDQALEKKSAETPGNYTVASTTSGSSVNVLSATLDRDSKLVHLRTESQPLQEHRITVTGVKDTRDTEVSTGDLNGDGQPDNQVPFWPKWITHQPGWPQATDGLVFAPPTLIRGDANGDGVANEVLLLAASLGGRVYAWDAVTSLSLPGWPQSVGSGLQSSPAAGDIDNDGAAEVVSASASLGVFAWNLDGSLVDMGRDGQADWPQPVEGVINASPTLADLDGDGALEIVVATRKGYVYAWNGDGSLVDVNADGPDWPLRIGTSVSSTPAAGDLDGDGVEEVVMAADDGRVYAWNGDGTAVPGWPVQTGGALEFTSPLLCRTTAYGPVVVIGSRDGRIYAWRSNGTPLPGWPVATAARGYSTAAVVDLNGNGRMDPPVAGQASDYFLFGSDTHEVFGLCLDGTPALFVDDNGNPNGQYPKSLGVPQLRGAPVVTFMDYGDGRGTIPVAFIGGGDGSIRGWNARTGADILGWRGETGGAQPIQPQLAVGDLDSDGRTEIIAGVEQVYILDAGPNTHRDSVGVWPMFGYNERHSGFYQDPPLPLDNIGPRLVRAVSLRGTQAVAYFSERLAGGVGGPAEKVTNYRILDPQGQPLTLTRAQLQADHRSVLLTTAENQAQGAVYVVSLPSGHTLTDLLGNAASLATTVSFVGQDTVPPTVDSVVALGPETVRVRFSEAMSADVALTTRYYTIAPNLTVRSAQWADDTQAVVDLKTSIQNETVTYELTLDRALTDRAGNKLIGTNTFSFVGVENIPPRLEAVLVTSDQILDVLFNETVDRTSAEDQPAADYRLEPDLGVRGARRGDQVGLTDEEVAALGLKRADLTRLVRLTTRERQTKGANYTLTVTGVTDLAGNEIVHNNRVQFQGIDTTPVRLLSASTTSVNGVLAEFSEAVDAASAAPTDPAVLAARYQIWLARDPTQTVAVTRATRIAPTTVWVETAAQTEGEQYRLAVHGVTDESGNAILENGEANETSFAAPSSNPIVVLAEPVGPTGVRVRFNKVMDQVSVEDPTAYRVVDTDDPSRTLTVTGAALEAGGASVLLTTDRQQEAASYEITVRGVTDASGHELQAGRGDTAQFTASSEPPQVWRDQFVWEGRTAVRLAFSEEMNRDSVEGPGNYFFTPALEVLKATLQSDGRTVRLETAEQKERETYVLRVRNVLDLSLIPIDPQAVDEEGQRTDTVVFTVPDDPPTVAGLQRIDETRLQVVFSEALDPTSAQKVANYLFTPEVAVKSAQLLADGRTVELTTARQAEDQSYQLRVVGVMDAAGVSIVDGHQNTADFTTPRVRPAAPAGVQARAVDNYLVVSWKANTEADLQGYHVYRATSLAGPFTRLNEDLIAPSATPNYEDRTGRPAVTYWYRVAAVDDGPAPNEGTLSDPVSATVLDQTAPTITHEPPLGAEMGRPLLIQATVTDEGQVGAVKLFFRTIGAASFTELAMVRTEGDDYEAEIPATAVTGLGVEYYLVARDTAEPPNEATVPPTDQGRALSFFTVNLFGRVSGRVQSALGKFLSGAEIQLLKDGREMDRTTTGSEGFYELTRVPAGSYQVRAVADHYLPGETSLLLASGEEVKDRRITLVEAPRFAHPLDIVAVPLAFPTPPRVQDVLGGARYRFGEWDPVDQRYVIYPIQSVSVKRGYGYWLNALEGTPPAVIGRAVAPNLDEPVIVPLYEGWNLIGNPFPYTISLNDLFVRLPGQSSAQAIPFQEAVTRGWVPEYLWDYTEAGYWLVAGWPELGVQPDLPPWNGFWLWANQRLELVIYGPRIVPFLETSPAKSRVSEAASGQWRLQLTATAGGLSDTFNFVGATGSARPQGLRVATPPRASPYVDLSFLDAAGRAYAVDLRPQTQDRMEWDFVVETDQAGAEVTLNWGDLSMVPQGYRVLLTDLETQAVRFLKTTRAYTFRAAPTQGGPGGPRRFRLTVERADQAGLQITGFRVQPAREGQSMVLTFTLSAAAEVRAEVRSLAGRSVAVLSPGESRAAGLQQLAWDGRDEQGRPVPPGTYVCEVLGVTETGETAKVIRTLTVGP